MNSRIPINETHITSFTGRYHQRSGSRHFASRRRRAQPRFSGAEKCCAGEQSGGRQDKSHGFHRRWERHRGHEFEGRMLSRLLNLTDEQKAKVKEIMEASRPKIKAIR